MADGDITSLFTQSTTPTTSGTSSVTSSEAYASAMNNSNVNGGNNWKNNPNYKLTITDEGTKTSVVCYLPEETQFRIQNQWEPILSLFNGIGQKAQDLGNVVGISANIKALTTKIWRHSEPLTFDFKLEFDAKDDCMTDVVTPVTNLIKMASPSRGAGVLGDFILIAPGPSLADGLSGGTRRISLRIGKMMYIDSVIINSLDINMPSAFDDNGNPIAMDCNISLETWYTPDKDDIIKYFEYGKSGQDGMIYNPDISALGSTINSAVTSGITKLGGG